LPAERLGVGLGEGQQGAEPDAQALVEFAQRDERAVQVDRGVVARGAQQHDHALAFAERIDAEQMRPLRLKGERGEQPLDLALRRLVAEDRQGERRFGDENVAGHELEGGAGRVGGALVVARDDDALALPFEHHLGGAEDVAGRHQAQGDAVDVARLAVGQRVEAAARLVAVAGAHDLERVGRGEHGGVVGPGVVGVAMGDHRAVDGALRIDVELARGAVEALGRRVQPGRWMAGARHGP
jgi:hypothetical protein